MNPVARHYETHLAPVYLWMAGGMDHALALGAEDVAECIGPGPGRGGAGGLAVDLGAGFGMHAIPLARAGYRVLAIDTSAILLEELARHRAGLPIECVRADLMRFAEHLPGKADLVVCMGDTLTHLDGVDQVRELMRHVADALRPGGRFLATFRNYTHLPSGESRFIPVRADADRILTCFLEERPGHVLVHDVLHERTGSTWSMKVSSYPKVRLSPEAAADAARAAGLTASTQPGPRGMVRLQAAAGPG